MNIQNHLLEQARQVPSPNHNQRPCDCEPELIVLHNISLPPGQFGGHYIEAFFQNCLAKDEHPYFEEIACLEVSSHLLIERDGSLVQFVPFNKRAWHAGQSCFNGRDNCNDFSIGIELEGTDDCPYEDQQYEQLKHVIESLQRHYPSIKSHSITGHCHIAPGRKTDPGPSFDWGKLWHMLRLS